MAPINVLVVDDSITAREIIIELLSEDPDITVVGEAENGKEALELLDKRKPDLVTMDICMPVMGGLETIEHIMATHAVPILVITSDRDAETAFTAISKGALEVLPKPDLDSAASQDFIRKVKLLADVKVISHIRGLKRNRGRGAEVFKESEIPDSARHVVAVASSTGGPKALSIILSGLSPYFPVPILVAQHMSDDFVPGMVRWLNEISGLEVRIPESGEPILPGRVYVSPSERHMVMDGDMKIGFQERHPHDIYFPSCDQLLDSVAGACGPAAIGVILTGMGNDGVEGMRRIKRAGGFTIAQDEQSSAIYGMPKEAVIAGAVDKVLSIEDIRRELTAYLAVKIKKSPE